MFEINVLELKGKGKDQRLKNSLIMSYSVIYFLSLFQRLEFYKKTKMNINTAKFDSLIRVKDSQIKEREQIIASLKYQINSLQTCYNNSLQQNLHIQSGNHPSTPNANHSESLQNGGMGDSSNKDTSSSSTSDKADLLLANREIQKLKEQIQINQEDYNKRISSLSRQLASEEHNGRNVQKHYSNDRDSLNNEIFRYQGLVERASQEKQNILQDYEAVKGAFIL